MQLHKKNEAEMPRIDESSALSLTTQCDEHYQEQERM